MNPAAPSDTFLRFDRVAIRLGGQDIVSIQRLDIARGEFVCIVGPSGCGKTTLLRAASGLLRPAEGEVRCEGRPITAPWREMALVFQDYGRALLPWRTVEGNVGLALEAAGVPRGEWPARIADALRKVGLQDHGQRFPVQLSGGMQQRAQIARCLAQRPRLMLLDEPFGALDALTRQGLQDELARLAREHGLTVLFVTHDLEEAIYLGDRVIAMRAHPGPGRPSLAHAIEVPIARPRHQLSTREGPDFLRLRRELFDHVERGHD
ncbi:ABC transporter ATP-binding protein [Hydrogenophaga sp. SNF1]|uniref:ABC transporter ATP-binding protein n=1 Tax=Hydrogenophaga borbori TaxID=2294117 RepID=A0A372EKN5_9BURK|nr:MULTISPECIES: ABC transporter ATP-binding protein [Hydrogenophaga]RFP79361.1 ABC transporter ATP-binding protein [Hydrogenophaga borbori]WQB84389.1 ABC transporter ATP-binding protein [Hydrogenophaga sp. SNF1]